MVWLELERYWPEPRRKAQRAAKWLTANLGLDDYDGSHLPASYATLIICFAKGGAGVKFEDELPYAGS